MLKSVCFSGTFMGRGAFLEHLWMGVCGCDCLEHIYGWVYLSRRHLFMAVTIYKTFMGGCDCLELIYGSVWVTVTV